MTDDKPSGNNNTFNKQMKTMLVKPMASFINKQRKMEK